MHASTTTTATGRTVLLAGRITGAALLAAMGVIHLVLWLQGYRVVAVIGPGFMVNAVGGIALAIAVLLVRARLLPLVAGLSALFMAVTLAALIISLTVGLFGVNEQLDGQLVPTSLIVEAIGTVVLVALAWYAAQPRTSS